MVSRACAEAAKAAPVIAISKPYPQLGHFNSVETRIRVAARFPQEELADRERLVEHQIARIHPRDRLTDGCMERGQELILAIPRVRAEGLPGTPVESVAEGQKRLQVIRADVANFE